MEKKKLPELILSLLCILLLTGKLSSQNVLINPDSVSVVECLVADSNEFKSHAKVIKKFRKQILKPLLKSSDMMCNGCLSFEEIIYGVQVRTNHYVLSWSQKAYYSSKPIISLQVNSDSIFYYSTDSVWLYDVKTRHLLYSGAASVYRDLFFRNAFISYYGFMFEPGGAAIIINSLKQSGSVFYADYVIPLKYDYNPFEAGRHQVTWDKSSNLLLQYCFEPCNPNKCGYIKKTYRVTSYQPYMFLDY